MVLSCADIRYQVYTAIISNIGGMRELKFQAIPTSFMGTPVQTSLCKKKYDTVAVLPWVNHWFWLSSAAFDKPEWLAVNVYRIVKWRNWWKWSNILKDDKAGNNEADECV